MRACVLRSRNALTESPSAGDANAELARADDVGRRDEHRRRGEDQGVHGDPAGGALEGGRRPATAGKPRPAPSRRERRPRSPGDHLLILLSLSLSSEGLARRGRRSVPGLLHPVPRGARPGRQGNSLQHPTHREGKSVRACVRQKRKVARTRRIGPGGRPQSPFMLALPSAGKGLAVGPSTRGLIPQRCS